MQLDVYHLKKMSEDYEAAKKLAVKKVSDMVDIWNMNHLIGNEKLIGNLVEDAAKDWSIVKEVFYQHTKYGQHPVNKDCKYREPDNLGHQQDSVNSKSENSQHQGNNDNCQLEEDGTDDELAMELEHASRTQ